MTDQEKEEIRKQVQNLPEDSRNSADSNTCCLRLSICSNS